MKFKVPIWHPGPVAAPKKRSGGVGGVRPGAGRPRTLEVDPTPLGQRLRALRESTGLTMAELARQAELTLSAVSKLESGATLTPAVETLVAITRVLTPRIPVGQVPGDSAPVQKKRTGA